MSSWPDASWCVSRNDVAELKSFSPGPIPGVFFWRRRDGSNQRLGRRSALRQGPPRRLIPCRAGSVRRSQIALLVRESKDPVEGRSDQPRRPRPGRAPSRADRRSSAIRAAMDRGAGFSIGSYPAGQWRPRRDDRPGNRPARRQSVSHPCRKPVPSRCDPLSVRVDQGRRSSPAPVLRI